MQIGLHIVITAYSTFLYREWKGRLDDFENKKKHSRLLKVLLNHIVFSIITVNFVRKSISNGDLSSSPFGFLMTRTVGRKGNSG